MKTNTPNKAVIYARVSTDQQVKEGDGLNSQITRCQNYAEIKGYDLKKVFRDEGVSGSLGPDQRPALKELFAYLDTQKDKFIVIVDDITRIARSMEAYVEFAAKLAARGGRLVSPSQEFNSTPNDKLVANLLVAVSTHQRDANIEQVINRQKARLLNGYWIAYPPKGYKYVKDIGGGQIMVRDEPKATVIIEALEGFAHGRFETQNDVAHFLTNSKAFLECRDRKFHPSRVKALLKNLLYTGHLEMKKWDVSLRKAKHPALISMETHYKILERLGLRAKAPYRKDTTQDFPLRGFALCPECNDPLTAAWSTGRASKHPYYRCKNKTCSLYGKGLPRNKVETDFRNLLSSMAPAPTLLNLTKEILKDVHKKKNSEYVGQLMKVDHKTKSLDKKIRGFLDRLLETEDKLLTKTYENHIKNLEQQRMALSATAIEMRKIDTSFEDAVGTVFDFIGKPQSIWENGDLEDKRLVLKLAFAQQVPYHRETGFGTAAMSLPFKVLSDIASKKADVVVEVGFEPTNS